MEERIAALETVGQMGPDQSDENRRYACLVINAVHGDDDYDHSDEESFVIIETLRQLGHPEAFRSLLMLMMAEELWSTGHPHDSTPYAELRARARAAILALGRETLQQCDFREALFERSPGFQLAALDIIGEFDDGGLAEDLELRGFAEDENPAVRQAAAEALEKITSRAAKNDAADG
jgi:HEAT repeat protein